MDELNLVILEHFNVSTAWPLDLFVMLGNFLFIQENIWFPFPVLRLNIIVRGLLCGWGSAECSF